VRNVTRLKALLDEAEINQAEFARGTDRSPALVSRLVSGEATPSKDTIDNSLSFLSLRLGRSVTYEEAFGSPTPEPAA
jgi:transcriptional regulator with XRE-family HTH domain